ncbi:MULTISPECIES: HD-GYP domain-containing protein [Alteromonadaceae]|uniref:HD-GYP domain-containing protein n=1 Tax=Alteromonadaceae TaxID=72275 RepID=UPI001C092FAE|nr:MULTISPECIES: HD domain-containing phosphohydrolase [Aliiglaciecola]MBU2878487.1 HD domain-containing protein [Aliiglaciecola lipolytica]MDO6709697.1 HD domain-containing phosphohydrolase [Aliiglaciecola sp. 2_MG-2023]MDO6750761.1 HD domain-containing phosphohydrolase [Aliiglaciecola sp. 1_MG-2023]
MQTFTPEDLDDDILNDLLDEINELYEASEQTLIELELRPEDNELQRSLFRSVHTIKGDLGLVNFKPLLPLLQHVEDLLDFLRKNQVRYTSTMSDLVLLTMDRVKIFVESCFEKGFAQYDPELYRLLVNHVAKITPENSASHEQLLSDAVLLLNPDLDHTAADVIEEAAGETTPSRSVTLANTGIPKGLSNEKQMDILFFRELMKPIERRSMYWEGRGDRIAKLAFYINSIAGNPIEEDQLAVACYVHDFGMAFMPLSILHKEGKLTANEFNLVRSHVYKSSRLLEHLDQWNSARKIVMQHHERIDGSGYPLGIKDKDICEGARLLAILDSFDAITHSRAYTGHNQQPKKRAVVEINRAAEGQYCKTWLGHFNRGMAVLLTKG